MNRADFLDQTTPEEMHEAYERADKKMREEAYKQTPKQLFDIAKCLCADILNEPTTKIVNEMINGVAKKYQDDALYVPTDEDMAKIKIVTMTAMLSVMMRLSSKESNK